MTREEAILIIKKHIEVNKYCEVANAIKICEALGFAIEALRQPEIIRCEDCRWGKAVCGNIECFVDTNVPPVYHGYDWFCPNGERRTDG